MAENRRFVVQPDTQGSRPGVVIVDTRAYTELRSVYVIADMMNTADENYAEALREIDRLNRELAAKDQIIREQLITQARKKRGWDMLR